MKPLPAIAIGGPPHSGKSVLTYALTQILREQAVAHYVLRACPDGEGDWSQETPPEMVRLLRNKGQFTDTFVANVNRVLQQRHLPLLVDVGGRPTQEQEVLFDACTHAILLAPEETALAQWRALVQRHKVTVLAELHSTLTAEERIEEEYPVLRGRISGLERHQPVKGALIERLAWNVRTLFAHSEQDLRSEHLRAAPAEIAIDIERMARAVGITNGLWQPHNLAAAVDYLPANTPLAIYGRGPNWLYAALAAHAAPAAFYQFDARLGWVTPTRLQIMPEVQSAQGKGLSDIQKLRGLPPTDPQVQIQVVERADALILQVRILDTYLDYSEAELLPAPPVLADRGLIIHGKLPHWLVTGFVRAYVTAPWLAVYQPQLQGAVVIAAHGANTPVGSLVRC